jgi:hypothetical protein
MPGEENVRLLFFSFARAERNGWSRSGRKESHLSVFLSFGPKDGENPEMLFIL